MLEVPVQTSDDPKQAAYLFDKAVKKFKKILEKEGTLKEVQDRRYYIKTGDVKRKEQKDRERNSRKEQRHARS